ncbi:MAG: flavodoxin [Candidatus Lokiarchaeota archaeon]|nr:flavodoxin [Candidatus Lokiarchaeota archaeon]
MTEGILVVYYSLTGNTELIAESIAEAINADLLKIEPNKEISQEGGKKFLWGGKQSIMHEKPELQPYSINPEDYNTLILGTPVWAWNYSPPIRSFIEKHDLKNKNIGIWVCCMGKPKRALRKLQRRLYANNILGITSFIEPLKHDPEKSAQKAKEWASSLIKTAKADDRSPAETSESAEPGEPS